MSKPHPIIGSHTTDIAAGFSASGERLVMLKIGLVDEKNPRVYAFQPDQARDFAQRLLKMADEAEALRADQN